MRQKLILGTSLLSPSREDDYDYLDTLKSRYKQKSKVGVHYAFGGGMAVKILLDADDVEGVKIKDKNVEDSRYHKDIEVSAFDKIFGRNNPNPHDICSFNIPRRLHKLDYSRPPGSSEMYVEIVRDSYFGFVVPTTEDVRVARLGRKRYIVLSPEFLIASKTFKTKPFRPGVDDVDAEKLLAKFEIDRDGLVDIAKKTHFAQILTAGHLARLEDIIANGKIRTIALKEIRDKYSQVFPEVAQLAYSDASTLLEFNPLDLTDGSPINENYLTQGLEGNVRLKLGWMYLSSSLPCRGIESWQEEKFRDEIQKEFTHVFQNNVEVALWKAMDVKRSAVKLRKLNLPHDSPSPDSIIRQVAKKLITEPFYIGVVSALYQQMFEQAVSEEYSERLNETFEEAKLLEDSIASGKRL